MRGVLVVALLGCCRPGGVAAGWTPLQEDEQIAVRGHTTLIATDPDRPAHEAELALQILAFDVRDGQARRMRLTVERDTTAWAGYARDGVTGVFDATRAPGDGALEITRGGVAVSREEHARLAPMFAVVTRDLAVQRKLLERRFENGGRYTLAPAERTAFGVGEFAAAAFVLTASDDKQLELDVELGELGQTPRKVGQVRIARGGMRIELATERQVPSGDGQVGTVRVTRSIVRSR